VFSETENELLIISYRIYQDELIEGRRLMREGAGMHTERNSPRRYRAYGRGLHGKGSYLYDKASTRLIENIRNILTTEKTKIIKDPHGRIYLDNLLLEETMSGYSINGLCISKIRRV
jgi:hypothetical protein